MLSSMIKNASARDIDTHDNNLSNSVSRSLSISNSPTNTFHSPPQGSSWQPDSRGPGNLTRQQTGAFPKQLKPFREEDIKILLLENVNQTGQDILRGQGYQVEALKSSLPEDQLIEKIRSVRSLRNIEL